MKIFINEALQKGLTDYLSSKNNEESILYNSFLVVVVRMLVSIYGELDIINPYKINNEEIFDSNMMKYGASKEIVDNFKRLIDGFFIIEKRNNGSIRRETNIYFIDVQKILIDLFNIKRINFGVSEEESKEFFDLLYTPGTSNSLRLSYNYLNADDIYEVAKYYQNSMKIKSNNVEKEQKDLLSFDVYKLFNISIADLSKMNKEEVEKLNSGIYKSLDINENAINKDYLLEEKYRELTKPKLATGNGYVDILLIASIIVTVVMIIVIFTTLVF